MKPIQTTSLQTIDQSLLLELMNHPLVGRQLPLLVDRFSAEDCHQFLQAKQLLWDQHGYGPWAFLIDGHFAGWGGLQSEQGDADIALVLHPHYWGWGKALFELTLAFAFEEKGLDSTTILLPVSRQHTRAVKRLGFVFDGDVTLQAQCFKRYRLTREMYYMTDK